MAPMLRRPARLAAAFVALSLIAAACGSAPGSPTPRPSATAAGVGLELQVVTDIPSRPLAIAAPADGTGRLFVVDQGGRIWLVRDGRRAETPFVDIAAQVTAGGEQGLLGLAFHPSFPDDPRFFTYYTDRDGRQVVSAWRVASAGADEADRDSEAVYLRMDDFAPNHNGGALVFGPDGNLYISTGDGGGGGDPRSNGQKLDTYLGKILRIDVDATGVGKPYDTPADNPFVERDGAQQEIWVTGLRNPWRISFDRATGDLWIGDVGHDAYEEIDVVRAGSGGGQNFGWNITEGFHCYPSGSTCPLEGLTRPVTEYDHSLGCSVTGGVVYRGAAHPELAGSYIFADYCSGNVWLIDAAADEVGKPRLVLQSGRSISSFGEDEAGELYATDIRAGELLRVGVAP
ncbi:MAG: PQQ-dependent sugar dehydrogenase [Chloroflexota bacterium]|nr:PQQ-dependent sugar dehydrogenase [Chloroflexota bacterium]